MIVGIGVDTVDIQRFERQLERTPKLRARLFSAQEQSLSTHSLAARFAAREALIKALGDSGSLSWADFEIMRDELRSPEFVLTPKLRGELSARGANRIHLTMTHDAGIATAFVIVERQGSAS
ncbi:MAG: holo-ACP synthase [Leucobacter sp.]